MGSKNAKLRRNQLDRSFQEAKIFLLGKMPRQGWVKEIRSSLGMSMQDLADRLGVIKQRVDRIEKDEVQGAVTLKTLQDTAEAMNCELVYFFVPRGEGLQKNLEEQARRAAKQIVKNTEHTMQLEEQGTSRQSQLQLVEALAQEMLLKEDRRIWKTSDENPKSPGRNSP